MSLYNMINGVSPCAFIFLPMLGKHPDEYPRFRDCFLQDEDHPEYNDHIHVYTRAGGGNRESYEDQIQAMREMDSFVIDFDDDFDSTYATFVFSIPEKWSDDFKNIKERGIKDASNEYIDEMKRVYPKLAEQFEEIREQK